MLDQKGGPEVLHTHEVQPVVDVIRLAGNTAAPPAPPATPNSGLGTRLGFSSSIIGDGVNSQFLFNIIGNAYGGNPLSFGPQWPTTFGVPLQVYRYVVDALELDLSCGSGGLDGKTLRIRIFASDTGDPSIMCAYINLIQWARFNPDAQGRRVVLTLGGSAVPGGFEGAGYDARPWSSAWSGVHLCDNPSGSSMGLYCIIDTLEGTLLPAGAVLTANVLVRRGENGGLPILFP